jgi:hypothetical protein
MYNINRSIAIIRPRQAFIEWANQLPDARFKVSENDFRNHCLAVLIPEYSTNDGARKECEKNGVTKRMEKNEEWGRRMGWRMGSILLA